MSTGRVIGGATVRLIIDDRGYYTKLGQAHQGLTNWAAKAASISSTAFDRVNAKVARDADRAARAALSFGIAQARMQERNAAAFDRANVRAARSADRIAQSVLSAGIAQARMQARIAAATDRANAKAAGDADRAARASLAAGMAQARMQQRNAAAFDRANAKAVADADRVSRAVLSAGMAQARMQARNSAAFDRANARAAADADRLAQKSLSAGIAQARAQARDAAAFDRANARAARNADLAAQKVLSTGIAQARIQARNASAFDRANAKAAADADKAARSALAFGMAQARVRARAAADHAKAIQQADQDASRIFASMGRISKGLFSVLTMPIRMASGLVSGFLGKLWSGVKGIAGSIANMGLRVTGLGALAGGVGAAISLAYVIRQTEDMEMTLVRLRRTTGETIPGVRRMAMEFNAMGSTLAGIKLNNIYELAIMGARLGVPAEQLSLFTRDLAKTSAVLEDIPLEDAATRMSGLIDVFGLAYVDTIRLASALNKLDIESNANAHDILDITGRLSGMASTLGMSVTQTLALSTAMRQARIPVETAGTAMSQILGRMAGREMPQFARVAGKTVGDFKELMRRDALQALIAVEMGLSRLDEFGKIRALESLKLDGQRVRLVMLQLIPLLPRLNEYLGLANSEWSTTSSILKGFAMQAETASSLFVRMWNNVQLLAVSLGTALLPVLKGTADAITHFSTDVRAFVDGNGDRLKSWGESVGKVIESLGAISRIPMGDLFKGIGNSAKELWAQYTINAGVAFDNMIRFGSNAVDQLAKYITTALPLAITKAFAGAMESVARMMPARMAQFLGMDPKILGAMNKMIPVAPPAGNFFNRQNLMQGMMRFPGFQMPAAANQLFGQFAGGADAQRKDRNRVEAAGTIGDWITRQIGALKGRVRDPNAVRLGGMAAIEDAGGLGGAGGAVGGAGVGGDAGLAGGMLGPLGVPPAAGGAGGGAGNPVWMNRLALGMTAVGLGGLAGGTLAAARREKLMAWRGRMRAKHGGAANPWVGVNAGLRAQRRAIWLASGAGGRAVGGDRRMAMLRRLAAEQHRQQVLRQERGAAVGPQMPQWVDTSVSQILSALGAIERKVSGNVFQ
jgi:TP901 family phage tail tape measure protein